MSCTPHGLVAEAALRMPCSEALGCTCEGLGTGGMRCVRAKWAWTWVDA